MFSFLSICSKIVLWCQWRSKGSWSPLLGSDLWPPFLPRNDTVPFQRVPLRFNCEGVAWFHIRWANNTSLPNLPLLWLLYYKAAMIRLLYGQEVAQQLQPFSWEHFHQEYLVCVSCNDSCMYAFNVSTAFKSSYEETLQVGTEGPSKCNFYFHKQCH